MKSFKIRAAKNKIFRTDYTILAGFKIPSESDCTLEFHRLCCVIAYHPQVRHVPLHSALSPNLSSLLVTAS